MKKSSIVIALSLLAMSTLATADDKSSYNLSNAYADRTATELANRNSIQTSVKKEITCNRYPFFDTVSVYACSNSAPVINLNYTFDEPVVSIVDTKIKLSAWTSLYYQNFKTKMVRFKSESDCIIARDYAIEKIGASLLRKQIYHTENDIGYKFDNNIETRIQCLLPYNTYYLAYQTAERLSNEEIIKAKDEAKRKKEELKIQYENNIKSQVDKLMIDINEK